MRLDVQDQHIQLFSRMLEEEREERKTFSEQGVRPSVVFADLKWDGERSSRE